MRQDIVYQQPILLPHLEGGSTKTQNPESGIQKQNHGNRITDSRKQKQKWNTESVKEGSKRSI